MREGADAELSLRRIPELSHALPDDGLEMPASMQVTQEAETNRADTVIALRRPYGLFALATVMFGGCAAFFIHLAQTNDRGLIINGLIHLEMGGADIVYAVLALFSLGFVAMGVISSIHCYQIKDFRLVIGRKAIKLPGPLLRGAREVTVPTDRIVSVTVQPSGSTAGIAVREEDTAHALQARWLPPEWPLQKVADAIIERAQEAQEAREAREARARGKRGERAQSAGQV